jgi:hypothetical protein
MYRLLVIVVARRKPSALPPSTSSQQHRTTKKHFLHLLTYPQVTLNLWTFVMQGWMYAKRLPALSEHKVNMDSSLTQSRMEQMLPPHIQWPAQNFNHLHEQPTYFISTILALTYLGVGDEKTVAAAWGYVGIRIAHSLVQGLTNTIMVRFGLFTASSAVLLGLTGKLASVVYSSGSGAVRV